MAKFRSLVVGRRPLRNSFAPDVAQALLPAGSRLRTPDVVEIEVSPAAVTGALPAWQAILPNAAYLSHRGDYESIGGADPLVRSGTPSSRRCVKQSAATTEEPIWGSAADEGVRLSVQLPGNGKNLGH
jgi:hypothetical protein